MDVFLSYNRRDAVHAATLNAWLGSQGVATFFDQRDLGAGQLWLPDLERRIEHDAQAVAVLVGPAGLGNTQEYEYQLALTRQAADPAFPVIPVILPGTPDWRVPRGFLGLQTWISFAAAADPLGEPLALQRLLAAIRRVPAEDDAIRGNFCPYKGLGFYEEADTAVFFGRDAEADSLLATVTAQRVAALIGRSGSGKSSLVRAGLLPRLRRRPGAGVWDSLVIRPGEEPLIALADALSPPRPDEDPLDRRRRLLGQAAALRTDAPDMLAGTLRDRLGAARLRVDRLLIVVDQAEELFSQPWRLTDADAIRQFHADGEIFIRLLLEAAAQGPASVVLTIRSDFFDPLMHSPFAPVLKDALVQLGRIADLHPCIERPAAMVGLRFASGLVDRIVEEVGPEESNLPLLSHALERTWQRRAGPLLTADAYIAAGGVAQAINQAARDCYETLSPAERDAARRLFLRLVRPGEGTAHVRIRASVPEAAEERHVMDVFAHPDRRLLFVGEQAGTPVVEVAHEALVRGWDTLRDWVEASREKLRVRDAVTDWRASAGANELIPIGSTLLQRARELQADPGDVRLDRDVRVYIERSIAAADAAEQAARAAAQAAQRRRRRGFAILAAAALVFAGLAAASGWFWFQSDRQRGIAEQQRVLAETQRKFAEAQRARAETSAKVAESAAQSLIFDIAQGLVDQQGISAATVKHILDTALGVIDTMLRYSPEDPALLRLKMAALGNFADDYGRIGETAQQLGAAKQALAIARSLADAAPDDKDRQRDLSVSDEKVGDVLVAQGNLPEALNRYRDGLAIAERLARADPGNAGWQDDLSLSHEKVGDVLVAQGNLPEALVNYRADRAIMDRLARADPGNAGWQRDLSASDEKVGDVLVAQGNLPEALQSYRDGLAIAERLARTDPGNAGWQRDLSVSDEKVGDVLVAQGNLPEALKSYRDGLAIRERLARADPGNAGWQRDLSVSDDNVGDVLVAQGNLPEALQSYRDSLAIRERLARADPGNAGWQRDLFVSDDKVGDVLVAQGNLPEALNSYRDGLAIAERLARADPGNADWQRDLSISLGRVADTLLKLGRPAEARPLAERALAQRRAAIARMPNDPQLTSGLPYYEDLLRRAGGTP
ncbi:MAG TPA: tetratricopeptide repeat protein [Acetobacteraceae bacterium]